MKIVVIGLGVQGLKRQRFAGGSFLAAVDPINSDAEFQHIAEVPLANFDAAMICTPDEPKADLLRYLISNGKHVLVEKPLWAANNDTFDELEELALKNKVVCYTAYNHRFEPHFSRMRDLIHSGKLGQIYRCRMFYGNGTASLVKESQWRDKDGGVLPDLGSHLLDTLTFWFGPISEPFKIISANRFENRAPDHVVIGNEGMSFKIELEMTLLMWRNHFTCDILAENGSAHIESLCKWGPAKFIHRNRVRPSGRPEEDLITIEQDDPTWALEHSYFMELCKIKDVRDLAHDRWIQKTLRDLTISIERGLVS
jgi:scyllo-inositol 2-dehydrogenase (NADP+)